MAGGIIPSNGLAEALATTCAACIKSSASADLIVLEPLLSTEIVSETVAELHYLILGSRHQWA